MQKLLKSWKVLSFGVVAAAFGLMMASCVETGDPAPTPDDGGKTTEPTYKVTIYSGYGYNSVDAKTFVVLADTQAAQKDAKGAGSYAENAEVNLLPGSDPANYTFAQWTWSPKTLDAFQDPDESLNFDMPKGPVSATAWFVCKTPEVRYTWEAAQEKNIYLISASVEDVASWYSDVYEGIYQVNVATIEGAEILDYVSHIPLYDGAKVPNNIFPTLNASDPSRKSVYYKIDQDNYTAICSAIDPVLHDTLDIVANYEIKAGTAKPYFEVGFDVGTFIDEDYSEQPDTWISLDQFGTKSDSGDDGPRLEKIKKAKAVKLLKKIKKDNVTYYVFKRPAKK